ncbi:MAG: helix-turn-helix domain-containing protein [Oscillospiraceae bacterium]|nr:helix-turn-helix domain-containing protein [Oscillospiraceae bacterium]
MISKNLMFLRRKANLSQEALAEKIKVSRQTLAKWENGESIPDVLHCDQIAELFEISLDDLLHTDLQAVPEPMKGKYVFGTVTVGEKGQIVIPVKARRIFGIRPGDSLMVLGDEQRGLALVDAKFFLEVANQMQEGKTE